MLKDSFEVRIDLEMNRVNIYHGIYNNYEYECNSLNEVGEIVQDFVNEYVKGE